MKTVDENGEFEIDWIDCDQCECWFYVKCIEKYKGGDEFVCEYCTNEKKK